MRTKRLWNCCLVATGLLLASVANAEMAKLPPGWSMLGNTGLDYVYARSDIPLGDYDRVIVTEPAVWHTDEAGNADTGSIRRLQEEVKGTFRDSFEEAGFVVASRGGENTLRLRIQIVDLKRISNPLEARNIDRQFRFDVAPGRMTMVAELLDSVSGEVLLRLADLEDESSLPLNVDQQVARAIDDWATSLGGTLARLSVEAPTGRFANTR